MKTNSPRSLSVLVASLVVALALVLAPSQSLANAWVVNPTPIPLRAFCMGMTVGVIREPGCQGRGPWSHIPGVNTCDCAFYGTCQGFKSMTVRPDDEVAIRMRVGNSNNSSPSQRFYIFNEWIPSLGVAKYARFSPATTTIRQDPGGGSMYILRARVRDILWSIGAPVENGRNIGINGTEMGSFAYDPNCSVNLHLSVPHWALPHP
jgi:hypothetical protein